MPVYIGITHTDAGSDPKSANTCAANQAITHHPLPRVDRREIAKCERPRRRDRTRSAMCTRRPKLGREGRSFDGSLEVVEGKDLLSGLHSVGRESPEGVQAYRSASERSRTSRETCRSRARALRLSPLPLTCSPSLDRTGRIGRRRRVARSQWRQDRSATCRGLRGARSGWRRASGGVRDVSSGRELLLGRPAPGRGAAPFWVALGASRWSSLNGGDPGGASGGTETRALPGGCGG